MPRVACVRRARLAPVRPGRRERHRLSWRKEAIRIRAHVQGPLGDALVRICSHYFARDAFLEDGVLIREAGRLASIPGILIHGRSDLGGPVITERTAIS